MAIVIEEEKRNINWFNLLVAVLIIAFLGAAAYFLFFTKIPLVEKVLSPKVQPLTGVSQFKFNPELITDNEIFKILKEYAGKPQTGEVGRDNPFVAP